MCVKFLPNNLDFLRYQNFVNLDNIYNKIFIFSNKLATEPKLKLFFVI